MITLKEFKEELLRDPEIKREFDRLEPEYALMEAVIRKRIEKRMTQKSLAQRLHTKQSAISRLESGLYNPTLGFLKNVATALDCKLNISLS
ncbi:MAG: helix-turn-helix transcriptional regulator [Patescibacteria group bacterium]